MGLSEAPRRSQARWIVLVGRGQDELYEHLREVFRKDKQVEVVMDRRKDPRRSPAHIMERLRTHGVAVIRREP
jgi:hypothetical protein